MSYNRYYLYLHMETSINNISFSQLNTLSGVYIIKCNQHLYIGSSKNLYRRLKEHVRSLKNHTHYNTFLQNVIDKHGLHNTTYKILETCVNYVEKEKYYIDLLNPDLNVERDPVNRNKSDSTKQKISLANKGKFAGGKNPAARLVHQYDLSGKYLQTFLCQHQAATSVGLSGKTMNADALKRCRTLGGYRWSFKKTTLLKSLPKAKPRNVKYTRITQTCINTGSVKAWKNIIDLAFALKVSVQSIYQAVKKNKACKGYIIKLN